MSDKTISKQERRDAARDEARRLREEQEKRDKRNRTFMLSGVAALILVAVIAVVAIMSNRPPEGFTAVANPAGSVDGGIPISQSLVAGEEGVGVRVDVYSDYTCSWCAVFEQQYGAYLTEAIQAGEVAYWAHPVSQLDPTGDFTGVSGLATNAAATVAAHEPAAFWAFHQGLFAAVPEGAGQLSDIESAAILAGVTADTVKQFGAGEFRPFTEVATAYFLTNVAQGTPHIVVNGTPLENWTEEGSLQAAIEAAK